MENIIYLKKRIVMCTKIYVMHEIRERIDQRGLFYGTSLYTSSLFGMNLRKKLFILRKK